MEMSWDNRDEWHIDHVIPCAIFDFADETQRKVCFHWSNLAPYPALDNISKGDKIIQPLIFRQLFISRIFRHITDNHDKTVEIERVCDDTGALTTAANGKLLVQQME